MVDRLTEQQRADRSLSEAEFRSMVDDLAEMLGWRWVTVGPLQTSHGWRTPTRGPLGAGWPDTVYVRDRDQRILFVEFKSEVGVVSPDQRAVLGYLGASGLEAHVWRPSDMDRITGILR